jgi:RNase adapter protein RapZ
MATSAASAVLITGLSGAGKSVVTRCFEDLGFRCVDNLPLGLIGPLFESFGHHAGGHWAVVVDVRTPGFTAAAPDLVASLKRRHPGLSVVFVEASNDAIVRRFSETRRPHPYRQIAIADAVLQERSDLEGVRALADDVIDTTGLTPHELRAEVASRFGTTENALPMLIRSESFGFRYGIPPDANLVLDVRFLPNPHFVAELRPLPGSDPRVRRWLEEHSEVEQAFVRFRDLIESLLPEYRKEQKSYLVIAFGCTGGRHRSVYLAERLAAHLVEKRWLVTVHHRDRDRES